MVHFWNGFLSQELVYSLCIMLMGIGGETTCQATVLVFSSEHIPITLSALQIIVLIHHLSLCSEFIVNYLLVIEETSMVLGNAHLLLVP
jgi:hypothetical protein